jgi:hypothetical protein
MDVNNVPSQEAGQAERADRAAWQIVLGVAVAIAGAVLAVASSPDYVVSVAFGMGLFAAGAALALMSASNDLRSVTVATPGSDPAAGHGEGEDRSTRSTTSGPLASVQLGPDLEQVIGRATGVRI